LISVALDLCLFDHTIEPVSSQQLATELSLAHEPTTLLLNALCGLNILTKNSEKYHTNAVISPYLISDSDYSMRDMLLHLSEVKHSDGDTIKHILRTNQSTHLASTIKGSDFWEKQLRSLYSFHSSIGSHIALTALQNLPEWLHTTSILDLGAGSECLSQAIFNKRPDIHVTLFDLPKSTHHMRQRLPVQSPTRIIAGDFTIDSLGGPYHIIWASMSLYYAKNICVLLRKIKQSLEKGGVFISFHEDLDKDRVLPERHATGRFLPAISGNDLSFSAGYIANAMRSTGFLYVESKVVSTPMGDMRLDIASCHPRKSAYDPADL
jgi:hypothetical protein